jgi:hypothetical protein
MVVEVLDVWTVGRLDDCGSCVQLEVTCLEARCPQEAGPCPRLGIQSSRIESLGAGLANQVVEYLLELTAVRYPESATHRLIGEEPQLHATLPRQRLKMARELRRHTTLRTGLECLGVDAANLASLSIPASPSNLLVKHVTNLTLLRCAAALPLMNPTLR